MDTAFNYDSTGRMESIADQKKEAMNIHQLDLNSYVVKTNDRLLRTQIDRDTMTIFLGKFIFAKVQKKRHFSLKISE